MMLYQDEETTFLALAALMNKFQLAELFDPQLPKLKLFFYQLDRLISNSVDPELHAHFKDEGVSSGYFASAWFITLFTNSLK